jgi:dolichol-phosphate mannosyltransferase
LRKLISIIIPAFNEEACVEELASRLKQLFILESHYEFEVVIVENGSLDATWDLLKDIALEDQRFKIVKLSRNFRMDGGLTAGLAHISGDACVLMTADLQDPPELISDFLRHWELGWENIYGIVTKRTGTNIIRRFNSRAFYWLAGRLTDGRIPQNASDFRLVDKKVYLAVREMQERNRFVRGLFAWTGFRSVGIPMVRPERFGGVSNAPTLKVLDLAFKGIFAHSYKPLRMITILGGMIFLGAILSFALLVHKWITEGVPFPGYGLAVSISLLALGIFGLMLGIISEYLGLVYEEVKGRPNYVVSETVNFN